MDQLLDSLLVYREGHVTSAKNLQSRRDSSKATTVGATPFSSQEGATATTNDFTVANDMNYSALPQEWATPSADHEQPVPQNRGLSSQRSGIVRRGANVMSIADFEAEHPYQPSVKLVPTKTDKSPSTGGHSWKFHDICYTRGLPIDFTFDEVASGRFTVKVSVGGQVIEDRTHHPSKKEAKEAICKRANEVLFIHEQAEGTKRKRCEDGDDAMQDASSPAGDLSFDAEAENWIGLLNGNMCPETVPLIFAIADRVTEFTMQQHLPLPRYTETPPVDQPTRFVVTVEIGAGSKITFGANQPPAVCKKTAKKIAAAQAVLWLREMGKMPETSPAKRPAKLQKATISSPAEPGSTGLSQVVDDMDLNAADEVSTAQQVHDLSLSFGFQQPRFEIWPTPDAGDFPFANGTRFLSTAAYYSDAVVAAEPRLGGPIGQVDMIYGKKKAKEQCCQRVLGVLESIQKSRLP